MSEFVNFSIKEEGAGNLVAVFQRLYPQMQDNIELDGSTSKSLKDSNAYNEASLAERIANMDREERDVSLEVKAMVSLRAKKAELGL